MRDQTIETTVARESTVTVTAMQFSFFFFLLSIVQTLVSIEHAMPVSGFISDKPEGFSLSIKRYFRGNLLKVNPFFFVHAAISYLVTHPNPPIPKVTLACVACLIKYLW